jgi:hypothetical protein
VQFSFNPEDGRPPRLIRYVDELPGGLLSVYDAEKNLLIINRPAYDKLSSADQHMLERTHAPALEIFNRDIAA